MGKKFKSSFILVTYALPTKQIQNPGIDIRKDNEAVASGPSFSEISCPSSELCNVV